MPQETAMLYESGFNFNAPINASGFSLDPITGVLEFTAGVAQSSVISVKIIEYDASGNLLAMLLEI